MSLFDHSIKGHLNWKEQRVAVEWAYQRRKQKVLFRSLEGEAIALTGVICFKETKSVTVGGGYMTLKGRDGLALQNAPKVEQFPEALVALARKVIERWPEEESE